jgi:hypothetical protein
LALREPVTARVRDLDAEGVADHVEQEPEVPSGDAAVGRGVVGQFGHDEPRRVQRQSPGAQLFGAPRHEWQDRVADMMRKALAGDASELAWFKSSYSSGPDGDSCVEVAATPGAVHVRDSKFRDAGPRLAPAAQAWAGVVAYVSGSRTRG